MRWTRTGLYRQHPSAVARPSHLPTCRLVPLRAIELTAVRSYYIVQCFRLKSDTLPSIVCWEGCQCFVLVLSRSQPSSTLLELDLTTPILKNIKYLIYRIVYEFGIRFVAPSFSRAVAPRRRARQEALTPFFRRIHLNAV